MGMKPFCEKNTSEKKARSPFFCGSPLLPLGFFRRPFLLFALLFLLFPLLSLSAAGAEEKSAESVFLEESYSTLGDLLPKEVPPASDTDALTEALSPKAILALCQKALADATIPLGKTAAVLLCFTLLFLLFRSLMPAEGGMGETALLLGVGVGLAQLLLGNMERVFGWISDISKLTGGLAALYGGIYTAGGSPGAAASLSGGLAVFCAVTATASEEILSPLLRFLAILCLLSPFGSRPLAALGSTVRGWCITVFGLFSALFPAAVGFQSALASSADSMAARAAKYALGSSIPVVGGALAGTLGTLSASLGLLRQTVGGGAFLGILVLSLPILFELFLLRFLLSLTASVADALSLPALGQRLGEWRGIYDLLLATAAAVVVTLFFLLAILSTIAPAVG